MNRNTSKEKNIGMGWSLRAGNLKNGSPSKRTITPSERGTRYVERAKRKEAQALDEKLDTEKTIGSSIVSNQNEAQTNEFINSQAHVYDSKLPSPPQLDKHHRVVSDSSAQPPLSFDSGLGTETSQAELNCKVIHQKRVDTSLLPKAERKPKINFPVSCDPIWKNVNNELEQIIPTVFPEKLIKSLSTSDLSLKFDSWLYQFFLDRFGKQEQKSNKTKRAFRPNKQLEFLRIRKKQCKAAHKALVKAGLTGTEEEQTILKQWHSLL